MDITKFFDQKVRELSSQLEDGNDSKRPREESNNRTSTPASPGEVFRESLKSSDWVKILVNFMQNIEKQVKELFLLAQENKEKHIKGKSDLSELTKTIDLIPDKFDDYERKRREKDKFNKELKREVSDLNTSVKNLENQLDRQEQYTRRNCILIHGITKTQDESTDDISLRTINGHLEVELTEEKPDRTHRICNAKSSNKRPRPIIVKFVRYNTRRKVFVNKKVKKYWNFNYRKSDQTQDEIFKKSKKRIWF